MQVTHLSMLMATRLKMEAVEQMTSMAMYTSHKKNGRVHLSYT